MKLLSRILKYSKKATSTTHRKQIKRALFFGRKDDLLATFAQKNLDTTRREGQTSLIIPGPTSPFCSINFKNWPERARTDIPQLLLRE